MKKLFVIAALFVSMAVASAQQFGVKGGLTLSTANGADKPKENKAMVLYEAGILYKADLGAGFAIQPSLLYQVKGANVGHLDTATDEDFKVKTGFVELPLGIQWGPELGSFRPFVFGEPFIGYRVSSTDRGNETFQDWASQAKNKFEYGFGLGAGLEISDHLQLSVQWFNNLGTMFSKPAEAGTESLEKVKNFEGIKFSLAILF